MKTEALRRVPFGPGPYLECEKRFLLNVLGGPAPGLWNGRLCRPFQAQKRFSPASAEPPS